MIPDALWHDVVGSVPIVCVDVAIVHRGAALLVLRSDPPARGEWWVPGGRVLKGESLEACARRKARDEVGLDCLVGPAVHRASLQFPDGPGGRSVHAFATCFLLTPTLDPVVRLDGHHRDHSWCSDPDDFWADVGEEIGPVGLHDYVKTCLRGAGL